MRISLVGGGTGPRWTQGDSDTWSGLRLLASLSSLFPFLSRSALGDLDMGRFWAETLVILDGMAFKSWPDIPFFGNIGDGGVSRERIILLLCNECFDGILPQVPVANNSHLFKINHNTMAECKFYCLLFGRSGTFHFSCGARSFIWTMGKRAPRAEITYPSKASERL